MGRARHDLPGVLGRVGGDLAWRGPGQRIKQLLTRKRAGEQRPVMVGWQVIVAVPRVEEHNQPTAVVAADLFTDTAPDRPGHVDQEHISRLFTLGHLVRPADSSSGQPIMVTWRSRPSRASKQVDGLLPQYRRVTLCGMLSPHSLPAAPGDVSGCSWTDLRPSRPAKQLLVARIRTLRAGKEDQQRSCLACTT
jgi:hypothetical protein